LIKMPSLARAIARERNHKGRRKKNNVPAKIKTARNPSKKARNKMKTVLHAQVRVRNDKKEKASDERKISKR